MLLLAIIKSLKTLTEPVEASGAGLVFLASSSLIFPPHPAAPSRGGRDENAKQGPWRWLEASQGGHEGGIGGAATHPSKTLARSPFPSCGGLITRLGRGCHLRCTDENWLSRSSQGPEGAGKVLSAPGVCSGGGHLPFIGQQTRPSLHLILGHRTELEMTVLISQMHRYGPGRGRGSGVGQDGDPRPCPVQRTTACPCWPMHQGTVATT